MKLRDSEGEVLRLTEESKLLLEEVTALKEEKEDDKERQAELQKRLNKTMVEVTTWQQKCQNNEGLMTIFKIIYYTSLFIELTIVLDLVI